MWAGREGRGVIGRASATQRWPPVHSANERWDVRTRVRPGDWRDVANFPEKISDSTFLVPRVFFRPRYHTRAWTLHPRVKWCRQVELCSASAVSYGLVGSDWGSACWHHREVFIAFHLSLAPTSKPLTRFAADALDWLHSPDIKRVYGPK